MLGDFDGCAAEDEINIVEYLIRKYCFPRKHRLSLRGYDWTKDGIIKK